jgi:hypothetical protein
VVQWQKNGAVLFAARVRFSTVSRLITIHERENGRLPGCHVQVQASPQQIVAIPFVTGSAELIFEVPFLATEIREW